MKQPKLRLNTDMKNKVSETINRLETSTISKESNELPEPRVYKRILYTKLKPSPLNDYPINGIEEMELLLLQEGLLEPLNVCYIEDNDIYEIENGERRFRAMQNLFKRFERRTESDFETEEEKEHLRLYQRNIHPLYTEGIHCMLENGAKDKLSVRNRIIIHNETNRPFDLIRTSERLQELFDNYKNQYADTEEKVNINQKIADSLKGRYSVRQIIRYRNFSSLIPELKEAAVKYDMSISEMSKYHDLTEEEQSFLLQFIVTAGEQNKSIELPSKKELLAAIAAAKAPASDTDFSAPVPATTDTETEPMEPVEFSVEADADTLPLSSASAISSDNSDSVINNTEDTQESDTSVENSEAQQKQEILDLEGIKQKAAEELIKRKTKNDNKIKTTVTTIQKKSEQLEKIMSTPDAISPADKLELLNEIEEIIQKLNSVYSTLKADD